MPAPTFFIGAFQFLDIIGFPDPAKPQVAIEARPGTNAHALWLTGTRGRPVQLVTWRDCANLAAAIAAYESYIASIGASVNVTWADYVFDYQFDILDVVEAPSGIKRIAYGIGGVGGTSGALAMCQWTLIGNRTPKFVPEP